jgi:cytochrome P450
MMSIVARLTDAPAYLRDRLGFLEQAAASANGLPARVWLGTTVYLLTDPEDIEHVLLRNHVAYGKTRRLTGPRGRRLLGKGMQTSVGEEHIRKRRAFASAFTRKSAPSFEPAVRRSVAETLERWRPGVEVDLADEGMRLTRRTILRVLFGVDAPEVDELDEPVATRQRFLDYSIVSLSPRPELMPRRMVIGHHRAARQIDRAIAAAIVARRLAPRDDLISLLCAAQHVDGSPVSDTEVRDEALVVTVTGHETSGAALAWTLYLLALHPDAEDDALAQVEGPVEENRALERVLLESLRLYPPTWIFVRVALADDVLPSGLTVRAGQKLYLSQWVTHRDPRLFAEPTRFDPSRFDDAGWPDAAYFPFGGGPRLCIGKHIALFELALAVNGLLRSRRLELVDAQQVVPQPGLVLAPRYGIRAVVRDR